MAGGGHRFYTTKYLNMLVASGFQGKALPYPLVNTIFLKYVCARFDKKKNRYAVHTNG
jgi:hypothetical protein